MGWLGLLLLAGGGFALLWRFAALPQRTLEMTGAALLIGVAGYALQGSPGQPGSPTESRTEMAKIDVADIEAKRKIRGGSGDIAAWLDIGDAYARSGATKDAADILRGAIAKNPNSADLWVGLGNILVAHADGMMNPSAEFAFQRAAALSPEHPGPPFFFGLALAQQGKTAEAGEVWRGLLARTAPEAPWRSDLEARLAQIGEMPDAKGGAPVAKP